MYTCQSWVGWSLLNPFESGREKVWYTLLTLLLKTTAADTLDSASCQRIYIKRTWNLWTPIGPIPTQNPWILCQDCEERRWQPRRTDGRYHNCVYVDKIEGKRPRDRGPLRWVDQLYSTLGTTIYATLHTAQDRNCWRAITRGMAPNKGHNHIIEDNDTRRGSLSRPKAKKV